MALKEVHLEPSQAAASERDPPSSSSSSSSSGPRRAGSAGTGRSRSVNKVALTA